MGYLAKDDMTAADLRAAVERSFAAFAAGRTLSIRAAQAQHSRDGLDADPDAPERLGSTLRRMRRQIRELRTDLQFGHARAALAQAELLEEMLDGAVDLGCRLAPGASPD